MSRHRPLTAALLAFAAVAGLVFAGLVFAGQQTAAATTSYPLDPRSNIAPPAGAWGTGCSNDPMGGTCQNIMIRALNHARSVLGEPAYALPARFKSLRATDQLLVLANLDRKLYGRKQIDGLNTTLNASARYGASHGTDPAFVPVGGVWPSKGGSNWAGPMGSPLLAYYYWMFVDAPDWGHRHNTLMTMPSPGSQLAMGAATGFDSSGRQYWTDIFEAFPSTTSIIYLPTVVVLSSHSGSTAGGANVSIVGFGFGRVTKVTFGGVPTTFQVGSLNLIHAASPPHAAGRVFVRVTTRAGTSNGTAAAAYWYS